MSDSKSETKEIKKDSMFGVDKYMIYGGVIVLLVALLTLSVLTRGFGELSVMPDEDCPVCPLQCENTTNVDVSEPDADPYEGIPFLEIGYGDLPARGESDAPISLIEVSDYQCPYCSRFYGDAAALVKVNYVNTGKAKFYFRDFPLSFHDKAVDAAIAARCANEQDGFWSMHDMLFEKQGEWIGSTDLSATFTGYAESMGLDGETFSACYAARASESAINDDMAGAAAMGVRGTPASFIVLPKDKLNMNKFNTGLDTLRAQYGDAIAVYQDNDNVIAFVSGAYPYAVFDTLMKSVE